MRAVGEMLQVSIIFCSLVFSTKLLVKAQRSLLMGLQGSSCMVHSCVAIMDQGKHHCSREPSTAVPLLSNLSALGATTSSLDKGLEHWEGQPQITVWCWDVLKMWAYCVRWGIWDILCLCWSHSNRSVPLVSWESWNCCNMARGGMQRWAGGWNTSLMKMERSGTL